MAVSHYVFEYRLPQKIDAEAHRRADLILMDDLEAREEAEHHGLAVMGTLRVLELAAEHGLIDFPTAIMKLQATSFHLPLPLVREMLARDSDRKSRPRT